MDDANSYEEKYNQPGRERLGGSLAPGKCYFGAGGIWAQA